MSEKPNKSTTAMQWIIGTVFLTAIFMGIASFLVDDGEKPTTNNTQSQNSSPF